MALTGRGQDTSFGCCWHESWESARTDALRKVRGVKLVTRGVLIAPHPLELRSCTQRCTLAGVRLSAALRAYRLLFARDPGAVALGSPPPGCGGAAVWASDGAVRLQLAAELYHRLPLDPNKLDARVHRSQSDAALSFPVSFTRDFEEFAKLVLPTVELFAQLPASEWDAFERELSKVGVGRSEICTLSASAACRSYESHFEIDERGLQSAAPRIARLRVVEAPESRSVLEQLLRDLDLACGLIAAHVPLRGDFENLEICVGNTFVHKFEQPVFLESLLTAALAAPPEEGAVLSCSAALPPRALLQLGWETECATLHVGQLRSKFFVIASR